MTTITFETACASCKTVALDNKERELDARTVAIVIERGVDVVAVEEPLLLVFAAKAMQRTLVQIAELNMGITA